MCIVLLLFSYTRIILVYENNIKKDYTFMPKVSIIVPVYNVEEYLPKCLDSLVTQTLSDIEIICVNDGSTDNSLQILEQYARDDFRIKIVNQSNSGIGVVRNNALDLAQGEYIGFVDSDDWVSEKMFEILYSTAKKFDCDFVEESFYSFKNGNVQKCDITNLPVNKVFNSKDIENYIFSSPKVVWNKLFKTSFIKNNNIRFMETSRDEDVIFTVLCRALAKKIVYIDCPAYYYRHKNYVILGSNFKDSNNYTQYSKIMREMLISYGIFEQVESEFYSSDIVSYRPWRLSRDEAKKLMNELKLFLPDKYYKCVLYKSMILSFLYKVFSVYNEYKDGFKYKVFSVLGIKFHIRK